MKWSEIGKIIRKETYINGRLVITCLIVKMNINKRKLGTILDPERYVDAVVQIRNQGYYRFRKKRVRTFRGGEFR